MVGRRRKTDGELIFTLACGATPENAAQKTGFSLSTVYRRLRDPAFQAQVNQVRDEMVRRMGDMLTAAGIASLRTLTKLQESANSESVRLAAARAVIDLGCKVRESVQLSERVKNLEVLLSELSSGFSGPKTTKDN